MRFNKDDIVVCTYHDSASYKLPLFTKIKIDIVSIINDTYFYKFREDNIWYCENFNIFMTLKEYRKQKLLQLNESC